MSTNYVSSGKTVTLPAPVGGSVSGIPQVIETLAVMPLHTAAEGAACVYHTDGEWDAPAAVGLKTGAKVSVLEGVLVADGTEGSAPYGKLTSDTVNGAASVLIVQ